MRLALHFLAAYAAIVSACYVPFNNFRYINTTFFHQSMAAELDSAPAKGWTTVLTGNSPLRPWPKVTESVSIHYCYWDRLSYNNLNVLVEAANKMWRDKIETLEISLDNDNEFPSYHSYTSTGYIPAEDDSAPGRHRLSIYKPPNQNEDWYILDIAHELGHVFGMVHEHQHFDRDLYVSFDCTKLEGYDKAKEALAEIPDSEEPPTTDQICASNWMGGHYVQWSAPHDFSTDMGTTDDGRQNPQEYSNAFDASSIMIYPSWARAAKPNGDVTQVPLVKWKGKAPAKGTKPNAGNAELVKDVHGISDLDQEFIKRTYPW
ncbi:hypothetical protein FB567DRAFT_599883 [Paraphoma chrysanthemicola]|uniref:Peptidase M12A domain-containing protein n=1 Tax=Paraphoma chrysanthemicola TaxID=798071 RepID=A0A8K0RFF6_9PLEO|nr:hypothetical protein FB567DRAFT_599883 [Paraphoma chrysanthemicola]